MRRQCVAAPDRVGVEPRRRSRRRTRRCGERVARQPPPRGRRSTPPCWRDLGEDGFVVGRVDDDADVGVVLGRCPHHRRPADVDQLDARIGRERVQVRPRRARSARCRTRRGRRGAQASSRSASMPPCTFGCSVTTRWPRIAGNPVRSATSVTGTPVVGDRRAVPPLETSRPAELVQRPGQLGDTGLVVDGEQRGRHRRDRSQSAIAAVQHITRTTVARRVNPPTREKHMDFSKFKTSDWLMIAAGAVVLISRPFALDWAKVGSVRRQRRTRSITSSPAWYLVAARRGGRGHRVPARRRDHQAGRPAVVAHPGPRHRAGGMLLMLHPHHRSAAATRRGFDLDRGPGM